MKSLAMILPLTMCLLTATAGCAVDTGADGDIDATSDDATGSDNEENVAEAGLELYSSVTGHTYWLRPEPTTWLLARDACKTKKDFHLVTINNATEQTVLEDAIYGEGGWWWIGYNDRATESIFDWTSGGSLYNNWSTGQPDNYHGQDCAAMSSSSGYWADMECTTARKYICERNY